MTSSTKELVSHYGVHFAAGNIAWLLQNDSASNLIGLSGECPFKVKAFHPGHHCNHKINLTSSPPEPQHLEFVERVRQDPLFQAMMPIPKPPSENRILFLRDDTPLGNKYITAISNLARMSKPITATRVITQFFSFKMSQLPNWLDSTNVQPLVFVQAQGPEDQVALNTLAQVGRHHPRTTVVVGDPRLIIPAGVTEIHSRLDRYHEADLTPLPWEDIGAHILRKFMLGEKLNFTPARKRGKSGEEAAAGSD